MCGDTCGIHAGMRRFLTAELVRALLDYAPDTGIFTWRLRPESCHQDRAWNSRFAGRTAGSVGPTGYRLIKINGEGHGAHRLAWLYVHGVWAPLIDHINRNPSDNRIANLRPATTSQNIANSKLPRNNTSGHKGVHWDKGVGLWRARHGGRRGAGGSVYVGSFHSKEAAIEARRKAATAYYGEFAAEQPTRSPGEGETEAT